MLSLHRLVYTIIGPLCRAAFYCTAIPPKLHVIRSSFQKLKHSRLFLSRVCMDTHELFF